MIVDTHIHYTEPERPDRPYDLEFTLSTEYRNSSTPMLIEDVLQKTSGAGVDKLVQVTQTKMGYDNQYSLEGAVKYPERILGIIGRFDPLSPNLEERLSEYMENSYVLGVRFTLIAPQTKDWLKERVLDPFFTAAEKLDVPVQLFAPYQFTEMRDVARRFRGIRFLIDHMALNRKPARPAEQVFGHWRRVLTLAEEPNVWMKVSYFPEAARFSEPFPFPTAQQRFKELYEHVGAQRLIWGSNFPPVSDACTYREALEFVKDHCDFLSASAKEAILGGNFLANFAL